MTLDWKEYLHRLFDGDAPHPHEPGVVQEFVTDTAPEAFKALEDEMAPYVSDVHTYARDGESGIVFTADDGEDVFRYAVKHRTLRVPTFAFPEINVSDDEPRRHRAEVHVNGDIEHRDVTGWSQDALIRDVLTTYGERVSWHGG